MALVKIKLIDLRQGECIEVMQTLPDNSVDLILTDPPFGTSACKWDVIIPLGPMWEQLERVIKPKGAIVLMATQPFTSVLVNSNLKKFKYDWVWDKHIPRNFINAKIMPMNKHESVLVFGKGKLNYYPQMTKRNKPVTVKNYGKKGKQSAYQLNTNGSDKKTRTYTHRNPDTIITGKWEANSGKVHPTQKPVSLMEYLAKTYTKEGETILDFAMGSGTTGVACKNTNRSFIGIELDTGYFKIAEERIHG